MLRWNREKAANIVHTLEEREGSESEENDDDDSEDEPVRVRRGAGWAAGDRCRHHFPLFDPRCNDILY